MKKIIYYESFDEDVLTGFKNKRELSYDYLFQPNRGTIYRIAYGIGWLYSVINNIRVIGRQNCQEDKGMVIYCNHTQPVGDAFMPAVILGGRKVFTLAGIDNYAIPIIGKLIPRLGGIPVPQNMTDYRKFFPGVLKLLRDGYPLVIYPEAHVWPYYTGIRPFYPGSFAYPAITGVPVYVLTTTYQNRRKRPCRTMYLDGPVVAEAAKRKEKEAMLETAVREIMEKRAQNNTVEFIRYERRGV